MKITVEFDDSNENGEFEMRRASDALNGTVYRQGHDEVWEKCFRPNNKHGYNNDILDKESSYPVIEELIKLYQETQNNMEYQILNKEY